MRPWRFVQAAALAAVATVLGGCMVAHYRVTDTSNHKTYYTASNLIREAGKGGRMEFVDASTGQTVTILQTFEVQPITADAFEVGVGRHRVANLVDR